MTTLLQRITDRSAKVAVIGLGYVGLPLAVDFAKAGLDVVGIDTDQRRADDVTKGRTYIRDVDANDLQSLAMNGKLRGTTDFSILKDTDAVCICVPTPLGKTKDPDVSYILDATASLRDNLHRGQLICLESTTYPGTTRELVLPRLNDTGFEVGKDFFLAFSPERIDPGNTQFKLKNTPKVIGGVTDNCLRLASTLYGHIVDHIVPVSSTEAAEMVKLLENTFRSVNIGLVNEVAIMARKLGLDVWEVINAASTKPYGFMPFYPGPGLGGHCIPVDPYYLAWKLKTLDYKARFIELAGEINAGMPHYVVDIITDGLNERKKSVNGSKILILGLSYKRDIADIRESPSLDIINLLEQRGARISWNDPYVTDLPQLAAQTVVKRLDSTALGTFDCVVIVTDHSCYDWTSIVTHSQLVVDTRNATRNVSAPHGRVLKL